MASRLNKWQAATSPELIESRDQTMTEENEDEKQFFKDLGATAEQTVEEVRGFEVNYYNLIERTVAALPWLADFNKKMQGYLEQDFADALEFAHELRQAKDMQDFVPNSVRVHSEMFALVCCAGERFL